MSGNNNLYVGNLSYEVGEDQLKELFESVGEVSSCRVIRDRMSGRSKGFGFVEMANDDLANQALEKLNGQDFQSRPLKVSIAREREERPRGGGGGGRFGGGGGGRFGGGGGGRGRGGGGGRGRGRDDDFGNRGGGDDGY